MVAFDPVATVGEKRIHSWDVPLSSVADVGVPLVVALVPVVADLPVVVDNDIGVDLPGGCSVVVTLQA